MGVKGGPGSRVRGARELGKNPGWGISGKIHTGFGMVGREVGRGRVAGRGEARAYRIRSSTGPLILQCHHLLPKILTKATNEHQEHASVGRKVHSVRWCTTTALRSGSRALRAGRCRTARAPQTSMLSIRAGWLSWYAERSLPKGGGFACFLSHFEPR